MKHRRVGNRVWFWTIILNWGLGNHWATTLGQLPASLWWPFETYPIDHLSWEVTVFLKSLFLLSICWSYFRCWINVHFNILESVIALTFHTTRNQYTKELWFVGRGIVFFFYNTALSKNLRRHQPQPHPKLRTLISALLESLQRKTNWSLAPTRAANYWAVGVTVGPLSDTRGACVGWRRGNQGCVWHHPPCEHLTPALYRPITAPMLSQAANEGTPYLPIALF